MTLDVAALQIVQTIRSMAMEEAFLGAGLYNKKCIYMYVPATSRPYICRLVQGPQWDLQLES